MLQHSDPGPGMQAPQGEILYDSIKFFIGCSMARLKFSWKIKSLVQKKRAESLLTLLFIA
jgi:hypothetical protein